MSFVADEIDSQGETWQRVIALAAEPDVLAALPRPGERVAVVGCGTSLYMAQSCAALRENAGQGETDAFAASEFPYRRRYDRVVAITRSGTTTEIVRLLEKLRGTTPTTVLTTDLGHPVATLAERTVLLDFADEQSVVQTRFATAALAFWRIGLGLGLGSALADFTADLSTPLDVGLLGAEQFTFLGTGWTVGLANEAALKLREAAQAWAEAYPAMEFRHGPISVVDARSVVWAFGAVPEGLADEIAKTGARFVQSHIDPMAHLARAQRLAVALAERKGLAPDSPRHLTRSIVLSTSG